MCNTYVKLSLLFLTNFDKYMWYNRKKEKKLVKLRIREENICKIVKKIQNFVFFWLNM